MKKVHIYTIVIVAALIGSILYITHLQTTVRRLETSLQSAVGELTIFKLQVDSLEYTVTTKQGALVNMKQLLDTEVNLKEKYKALHLKSIETIAILQATLRITKDSLQQLPDSVIVTIYEKDTSFQAVKLPFLWEYTDKYVTLLTGIYASAQPYFTLKMTLDGEVLVGHTKQGPVGTFMTTNPYITITDLNIKVTDRTTKWYESKWFYFGAGFGLNTLLFSIFK